MGSFDEDFLELPPEVLVMVMRKHQRYFPVYDGKALKPCFVTVANGPIDEDAVREGNQAVLRRVQTLAAYLACVLTIALQTSMAWLPGRRARFSDARFFYQDDLKTRLEDVRPRLANTLFQKDLGSLLDKAERVEKIAPGLARAMGLGEHAEVAGQAARLARADLATSMVMEMTALAGTMGRHYAEKEGLPPAVCEAIFESVLPRSADDAVARTGPGIVVSVADKADSLVGLFAAKCAPTASADPYGLRRAALGLLQTLVENGVRASLRQVLGQAAAVQPVAVSPALAAEVEGFVQKRLEQMLVDRGCAVEAVRAVLAERGDDPALAAASAADLDREMREGGRLGAAMEALARPTRLARGKDIDAEARVDPALFEKDEERALYEAVEAAKGALRPGMAVGVFLEAAAPLCAPVAAFMDNVFVMAEDPAVRRNRLALLRDASQLASGVLDLSQLPGF